MKALGIRFERKRDRNGEVGGGVELFAERGSTMLVLIVGIATMWRPSLFVRSWPIVGW